MRFIKLNDGNFKFIKESIMNQDDLHPDDDNLEPVSKSTSVETEVEVVQRLTKEISARLSELNPSELKLVDLKIDKILKMLGENENKMELISELLKALYTDPKENW